MKTYTEEEYAQLTQKYDKVVIADPECTGCVFFNDEISNCNIGGTAHTYSIIKCIEVEEDNHTELYYIYKRKPLNIILKQL